MKPITNHQDDVITYWVLRDSTTHAPKTSITITDIDVYYVEEGAAIAAKADLTAHSAATDAHADNYGFEIGQGVYRIDWPDAAFDGGVGKSVILIVVCSGVDTAYREIILSPSANAVAAGGTTLTAGDYGASIASILADTGTDGVVLAADAITSAKIADDAISSEHLATGCLTADAFAADAIVAATLATGAITADAFAADAIVAATLATGALTADAFAADALVAATFATDCITDDAIATGAIASTAFAAGAITAAAIADAAIDNATFAADVGTTAYATNNIALAVDKAIIQNNLDHLCLTATAGADMTTEVTDNTILSRILANGDTSAFDPSTDGLQLIHDDVATVDTAVDSIASDVSGLATTGDIADAVCDEALSGHTTAGTVAKAVSDILADTGTDGVVLAADAITSAKIADDAIAAEHIATGAIVAATFAAGAIDAAAIATGAIDADAIADNAIDAGAIADGAVAAEVWNALAASYNTASTFGKYLGGAPTGATLAADIATIEGQTDDIGAAGAGLTAVPWNAAWDAEVQSECTDSLNAYDPPTKAELDSAIAGLASDADIADKVWDEAAADHSTASTFGKYLGGAPTGATLAADIATVDGNVDSILTDTGTTLDGKIDTIDTVVDSIAADVSALATTGDMADAICDEALSGHTTSGTVGQTLTDIITDTGTTQEAYFQFIYDWILNKLVTTDNEDGTYTTVLYADNGTTPLKTWTFTVATGSRSAAV
jgi:hypothetical protein